MRAENLKWPENVAGVFDYFLEHIEPLINQRKFSTAAKLLNHVKMQMTSYCFLMPLNAVKAYCIHLGGIFAQLHSACETGNVECVETSVAELKEYFCKDLNIPNDPEFDKAWKRSLNSSPA